MHSLINRKHLHGSAWPTNKHSVHVLIYSLSDFIAQILFRFSQQLYDSAEKSVLHAVLCSTPLLIVC